MKRFLTAVLVAAATAAGVAQHDTLGGKWRVTGDVAGNPVDQQCTFERAS